MRASLVLLHRWFGLFTAIFLFIAGLTGAIISWDHELDEWLNPKLFKANSGGVEYLSAEAALAIARQIEANDARIAVTYLPLGVEAGQTLGIGVSARPDSHSGIAKALDFNQMAIDPATAQVQGRREWGAVSLSRENLLPFLYKLHYSLHVPDGFGIELGVWFMGIVAIVWIFDCFIALWISFPSAKNWKKSFAFRWKQGGYKLNFDLHRSGGVWIWPFALMIAVTSLSMNLGSEVVRPLINRISPLTPSVFDERKPTPIDRPIAPAQTREAILAKAQVEARKRAFKVPAGAIFYNDHIGVYGVGFFEQGADHGDGGLGNPWLYFDAMTGELVDAAVPGAGSAGDIFMQAQFPLHSGRIIGLPGRLLISCMGLIVAMLSATGVVIWAKKRKARINKAVRVQADAMMLPLRR
jgi:uncharacterized iron-regulated membrane protein